LFQTLSGRDDARGVLALVRVVVVVAVAFVATFAGFAFAHP
jgi:hypothetical protein